MGSLWYRYQLMRYQASSKLKLLVPPILGGKVLITDIYHSKVYLQYEEF